MPTDQQAVVTRHPGSGRALRGLASFCGVLVACGGIGATLWYCDLLPQSLAEATSLLRGPTSSMAISAPPAPVHPPPMPQRAAAGVTTDATTPEPVAPPTPPRLDDRAAERSFERGRILEGIGRHHQSIPHFEAAVRAEPRNALARYHLGLAYLRVGDLSGVRTQQLELDQLDPNRGSMLRNLTLSRRTD